MKKILKSTALKIPITDFGYSIFLENNKCSLVGKNSHTSGNKPSLYSAGQDLPMVKRNIGRLKRTKDASLNF